MCHVTRAVLHHVLHVAHVAGCREAHMAQCLAELPQPVLAIVGGAHVAGLQARLALMT